MTLYSWRAGTQNLPLAAVALLCLAGIVRGHEGVVTGALAKSPDRVLVPVIDRYRDRDIPKYLRGDAAFAIPALYRMLEEEAVDRSAIRGVRGGSRARPASSVRFPWSVV